MSRIDERIVNMRFNNEQFERGIAQSVDSLEKLQQGLELEEPRGALSRIADLLRGMGGPMQGMADAVENVSNKFSVMGAVGFTIIQDLTRAALDFAQRVGRAIIDPIVSGGIRRAQNLEQAMFQFEGLGMDVEKSMDSANQAVLGTAFGLDEAAKAAAQFGASGLEAGDEMTSALRAISGTAAMTSSSYEDIARIFTTVAGNGRVMGNQLLQLSGRGLNAAAAIAEFAGVSEAEIRKMVTEGEVSFEMFYEAMDAAFGEHATKANETFTGSLANMRAALARIGADFASPSLTRFRDIFNSITPVINDIRSGLEPLVEEFERLSQVQVDRISGWLENVDVSVLSDVIPTAIQTAKNLFSGLMSVLRPIGQAFADIFPPITADTIRGIANALETMSERLTLTEKSSEDLRRTFRGVFAVFDIARIVIGEVLGMFGRLISRFTGGDIALLNFTGNMGDFLVSLRDAIRDGTGLATVIGWIETAISSVIGFFQNAIDVVRGLFGGIREADFSGVEETVDKVRERLEPLQALGEIIGNVWGWILTKLQQVWEFFRPMASEIGEWAGGIGTQIQEAFRNADWNTVLDIINTAFLGGIVLAIRRFMGGITEAFEGGFGLRDTIEGIFGSLTGALQDLQTNLKADTLLKIAGAIGILAVSLAVLSMLDSASLATSLGALTVMFGQLIGTLALFEKVTTGKGIVGMPILAGALVVLATAMVIMSAAVKNLAGLSWDEIARGLSALTGILVVMVGTAKLLSGSATSLFIGSAAMISMAVGIRIMASALDRLGDMNWEEIGRGMAALAGILGSVAIFTRVADPKGLLTASIGIGILALALGSLAGTMERMGQFDWLTIGKGLTAMAGALVAIGLAMRLVPSNLLVTAAGLAIVSYALGGVADTLQQMGGMTWEEIGKGLATLAGSLLILAGAMALMTGALPGAAALLVISAALPALANALNSFSTLSWEEIGKAMTVLAGSLLIIAGAMALMTAALPGAAALVVVSAALMMLTPVLRTLGQMSWGEIARGLTVLAGAFAVIGVAGLVLTPLIPTLLGLGVSIGLLGAAVALAGAGVFLFATGLTALGAAGAAGAAGLVAFFSAVIGLIPMIVEQLAVAIIAFAKVIGEAAPELIGALVSVITALLDAIIEVAPKFLETFVTVLMTFLAAVDIVGPKAIETLFTLLQAFVDEIEEHVPQFVEAGLNILLAILQGIADNMYEIVTTAGEIAAELVRGLGNNASQLIEAGADALVDILEGVENSIPKVAEAATDVVIAFIEALGDNTVRLVDAGWDIIIDVINGIADSIDRNSWRLRDAGRNLGRAIMDGLTGGLWSKVSDVTQSARDVASNALNAAKERLGISSPSKEFIWIGEQVDLGFAKGLTKFSGVVEKASSAVGSNTIETMRKAISGIPDILDGDIDLNPTISPVLDLTSVQRDAGLLQGMLSPKAIRTHRAYGIASERRHSALEQMQAQSEAAREIVNLNFQQTNNSPKPLSTVDLYRQTKNLMSTAKGAAGVYVN